jgi:hypothetical protein
VASSFPGSLDTLATNKQDDIDAKSGLDLGLTSTTGDHAQHHNDLADAVNKIETAVGTSAAAYVFMSVTKQAADLSNSSNTVPSATDMVFTFVANGVYLIDLFLMATSAAATTGYGFALDTSVAVTTVGVHFNHVLANTGTLSGGNSIADNTPLGISSGVATLATLTPITGMGILVASGTGGTATLTFRSEVSAASVTLKANSAMRVHRIA